MKNETIFRISFGDYKAITAYLEKAGQDESLLFMLSSKTTVDGCTIYICNRILIPDEKQLQDQSSVSIEPGRQFQAVAYGLAFELGLSIIDIHTHPFTHQARFSSIDDYYGTKNAEYISQYFAESSTMGMIVFGRGFDNFEARIWDREENVFRPVNRIEILGSPTIILSDQNQHFDAKAEDDLYARHRIISDWKQGTLDSLKVFVCGLGGNGAILFDSLLSLGVGRKGGWIKACDPDVLEISNLPRIPYAVLAQIGKSKAQVAQRHAARKVPFANIRCYNENIQNAKMQDYAKEANIIVGAIDNDGGRMILNRLAARYLVPYIDLGTEIIPDDDTCQAIGQVQVFLPGKTGCLLCTGAIDPSEAAMDSMNPEAKEGYQRAGYVRGTHETPTPSVLHLNGVISHLAISQMLRMVFCENFEGKEYVHYDRQNTRLLVASTVQDDDCPVCGINGYIGDGDEDRSVLDALSDLKDSNAFDKTNKVSSNINSQPSAEQEST